MKGKISLWGNVVLTIDVPDDFAHTDLLLRRSAKLIKEVQIEGGDIRLEGDIDFINKISRMLAEEANDGD